MSYRLIGGITPKIIIQFIPSFDALTPDFWLYANEYIPEDFSKTYNQQLVNSIRSNFWFNNLDIVTDFENNGLSISYHIENDNLIDLHISENGNILFRIK